MAVVQGRRLIERRLGLIQRNVRDAVEAELDDIAEEILERSRELAPQLTGQMILTAGVGRDDTPTRIRRSVFYLEDYAPIQHEGVFNPGPVTAAKAGAGRKFLQRAYNAQRPSIAKRVGRAIERALRTSLR